MTAPQPDDALQLPDMRQTWRGWRRWLTVALVVVVLLAGVYAGVELGGASNTTLANVCGQLSFTRRGLPCDIPLPSDAAFIGSAAGAYQQGALMTTWTYSTSQSESQLLSLFKQGLGAWSPCLQTPPINIPRPPFRVSGGDNPNRLGITLDIVIISSGPSQYHIAVSLIHTRLIYWNDCGDL